MNELMNTREEFVPVAMKVLHHDTKNTKLCIYILYIIKLLTKKEGSNFRIITCT